MRPPRVLLALGVATALGLAASACGSTGPDTGSGTPTPSGSLTHGGSPTGPSPTAATAVPSAAGALGDLLLAPDELPGLTSTWLWSVRDTVVDDVQVGTCLRTTLRGIGADQTVTRRFVPTGDDGEGTGAQVVGSFVDDRSADQAMAVLRSARARCSKTRPGVVVTPLAITKVARGEAWSYVAVVRGEAADDGPLTESFGVLRDGLTIEILVLDRLDQDGSGYPDDKPVKAALRAAAERLP